MALLRKIRSATLIESLVATVLILIVFVVASLVLNNLIFNSFSRNTHGVETRLEELHYMTRQGQIKLPYREEYKQWRIAIQREEINNQIWLQSAAQHSGNGKKIYKNELYTSN